MTHEELRSRAALVAALPDDDPDRAELLEHARGCAECTAALREGEKLQKLLGEVRLPAPSPAALQRARDAVLAEMEPAAKGWWLRAAAAVAAFLVPLLFARHRDPEAWTAALAVLALATLLAATAGALKAGALVTLAASAGFAFAAGGVPGFPSALAARLGAECFTVEMISAAMPLAAAAWLARRGNLRPGALAQAAAAGALAGQAMLHIGCSAHALPAHLWVFHVGGVLAAAVIGWLIEGRLSARGSESAV
ncbi:MAG: hypothetical protein ABR567_16720 [Myxococcales bacterium]|nr:hypothetical protein [Myxococcales bacterium]